MVRSADRRLQGFLSKSGARHRRRPAEVLQGRLRGRGRRSDYSSTTTSSPPTPTRTSSRTRRPAGFIELWGLPIEVWARVGKEHDLMRELAVEERRSGGDRLSRGDDRHGRGGAVTATAARRDGSPGSARRPSSRLNSSLALDWRLWPEDIEGSVAHARALRARRRADDAELDGHRGRPDGGRRRDRGRRLRAAPTTTRTCTWRSSAG